VHFKYVFNPSARVARVDVLASTRHVGDGSWRRWLLAAILKREKKKESGPSTINIPIYLHSLSKAFQQSRKLNTFNTMNLSLALSLAMTASVSAFAPVPNTFGAGKYFTVLKIFSGSRSYPLQYRYGR